MTVKSTELTKEMERVLHLMIGYEGTAYLRHELDSHGWWIAWAGVHHNTAKGLIARKFITLRFKNKDRFQLWQITPAGRKAIKDS